MLRTFILVLSMICVGSNPTPFDYSGIQEPRRPILTECGPDQIYECVNPCLEGRDLSIPHIQTCEDRALDIRCSEHQTCEYRCVCKEGFLRRTEGGECISEEECGPILRCGGFEKYTHCKPPCSNDTCSSITGRQSCESQEPCKAACVCQEGYFREEEGSPCIPLCLCPDAQESHDCSAWLKQFKQGKDRKKFKFY